MPFLLRLEIRDVVCFERVDSIFNLVTVAVSRHGGQGLSFASKSRGPTDFNFELCVVRMQAHVITSITICQ
jgi:hypothetical protein